MRELLPYPIVNFIQGLLSAFNSWQGLLGVTAVICALAYPIIWSRLPLGLFATLFAEPPPPLAAAIEINSLFHVRLYLLLGADPNGTAPFRKTSQIYASGVGEESMLAFAHAQGNPEVIKALLRFGARP